METCPLTDLYHNRTFMTKINEFKATIQPDTFSMVAIDIEHFRLFNKLYGRDAGDELIGHIAECLIKITKNHTSIAGYLGGDNFGILMPDRPKLIESLRDDISSAVRHWNNTIGFLPMLGVYRIDDPTISAEVIYDRATLALCYVSGKYTDRICYFDPGMETKMEEEVKLLSEIQTGLENDEFTFFAQPQCDISTGKIIGAEALVRWNHSTKGLIPPGMFIPVLEKNGIIHSLDRYVWKKVCEWLRSWIDRGYTPVPISINVSRIDMFSMDVPEYLMELLHTYDLPEKLVKVEITESAYAESNDKINTTVQTLRDNGFKVLMDDFGSGYSSLNMLKNISVDVIKLDMRFLDISDTDEEKGISILESIINMARLMRLPIIVEGVETETQEKFLQNMGCRYTQGYYYFKPLPIDQFETLLMDERRLDVNGLFCKQVEPLHIREFLDDNFFSDIMVNNILGPIAFYDMHDNQIEITRVNEQYFRLTGSSSGVESSYGKKFWNHVRDDDRPLLCTIFEKAYENPIDGADGYIHFQRMDNTILLVYIKVFFLKENDGHKLFYGALMDMTSLDQKKEEQSAPPQLVGELTQEQYAQMEDAYEKLPCGHSITRIILDDSNKPTDFEIIHGNQEMKNMCAGDLKQLKALALQAFSGSQDETYKLAYRAAYLGETVNHFTHSSVSGRYLQFTFYQYSYGYMGCMMRDVTHTHVYENALNSIMLSYREVYFVHLKDNHCRMIYPNENHILERGNYEEIINRHFYTGKILPHDEQNIRKFLSLENLQKVLKKQDTTEYAYKRSANGVSDEWCLTSFTVSERDRQGAPTVAIMVIRSIDSLMRKSKSKRTQYMAESLASMSEGFFIYRAVENEKILYANPRAIQIYGCETIEEFHELVNHSFRGMVHPDDLDRVEWEIHDQVTHSSRNMDYIQYRIIRKDGEVRWIDDCGHLENGSIGASGGLFYVFISDITDTITESEKTKLINRSKYFQKPE